MAPERILGAVEGHIEMAKKADIWSAGVMLYILVSGKPPFEGKTNDELLNNINKAEFLFRGKEWDNLADLKNLVYQLLHYESTERIDAYEAINHPFFSNILLKCENQNNFRAKRDPKIISYLEFFYVIFILLTLIEATPAKRSDIESV